MKIENMATKEEWEKIVLHLTKSEAIELRDSLEMLIKENRLGRPEHVPSRDFRKEIAVVISEQT